MTKDDDDTMCYRSELESAVKAEREACAKVCESYTDNHGGKYADCEGHGYECAEAIRARGNKT